MALFVGGPADGWRVEVDTTNNKVAIPINPHPPAFTPDKAVLEANTKPTFLYKREEIYCGNEEYIVYVPEDWNCVDLVDALLLGYKPERNRERLKYVKTAEGQLYNNDDRIADGRPYSI